jgi:hypothetical protein
MLNDRFVKIMLVAIACLLAGNLVAVFTGYGLTPSLAQNANAQSSIAPSQNNRNQNEFSRTTPRNYRVKTLDGFAVADLKDVVAVGDGKSFVVSNTKGFMVYQLDPVR